MTTPPATLADPLARRVHSLLAAGRRPVVVGIDGRSGSGKSTLAAALSDRLRSDGVSVTVIEGDEFYGGGSAATWDRRSTEEKVDGVIDWRRQREVLTSLRRNGIAEWHRFDWDADDWDTDEPPMAAAPVRATAGEVVVLEGAYSCRPELADLLDLRVLLSVPDDLRRAQLLAREGEDYRADWEARWSDAEDHYFGVVAPPTWFDLVLG